MANSNVSEILKIQTFTTFHFWKLWWLKNDQNASSESLNILGAYFRVKHDSKMTSGLLETLKEKLNLEQSYLMTCGCPKCLMKKVRTRLKQNIQKNIILSTLAMCFLLEKFWNILPQLICLKQFGSKHCTIPHTSWRRDHESSKCFRSIYDTFKCFGYKIRYRLPCFG